MITCQNSPRREWERKRWRERGRAGNVLFDLSSLLFICWFTARQVVRYFSTSFTCHLENISTLHSTPPAQDCGKIVFPSQPIWCFLSHRSTSLVTSLPTPTPSCIQWANCQVTALFFSPVSGFVCPAIIILINDTNRHLISPMPARVSCLCFSLIC